MRISDWSSDVCSSDLIAAAQPASAAAVRHMAAPLVAFSEEMRQNDRALRSFLFARMYRHYKVNRMTSKARGVVRALFDHYLARPDCLPDEWQPQARDLPDAALAARKRGVQGKSGAERGGTGG